MPLSFLGWAVAGQMAADHLWQSTALAALAGLVTLALRPSRAQVRHGVWVAASLKFLVPFAVLVDIGSRLARRAVSVSAQQPLMVVVEAITQPFSQATDHGALGATIAGAASNGTIVPALLLGAWAVGGTLVVLAWCRRWRHVAAMVRRAAPVDSGREHDTLRRLEQTFGIRRPIALVFSQGALEPGVFGILRPVLLWPEEIPGHLSAAQVEAILAHEVAHVRRRDNLVAAIHMLVEAAFWFHPLVWWLGARLVDERERACDEAVLRLGTDPQIYAESLLKTCERYFESPPACVAGVTGSDLKERIERIMSDRQVAVLTASRRLLLATAGMVALAGPIAVGVITSPRLRAEPTPLQAPSPQGGSAVPSFEVASVKKNTSGEPFGRLGIAPGGRFTANNVPLRMLIRNAYQLQDSQLVGGPGWITSDTPRSGRTSRSTRSTRADWWRCRPSATPRGRLPAASACSRASWHRR